MKTKLKTTLALFAAFCGLQLFTNTAYAEETSNAGENPAIWYKFDGNYNSSGSSSLTFGGENAGNWGIGINGQSLKITDGATHPYGDNWSYGSGQWAVTMLVRPIANASNKIVLWTTGQKSGWFGLLSDSANNKIILAAGNGSGISTTICEASVPNVTANFHLYTVRFVGSNTYELIVDGNVASKASKSYSTAVPSGEFQIGAVNNGLPTGLARTTGTLIDDLRVYQRAFADDEVTALSAYFMEKYHNQLAGDAVVDAGSYDGITVPNGGYKATALSSSLVLPTSGTGIGGSYSTLHCAGINVNTHTMSGWFKVTLPSSGNKLMWSVYNNVDSYGGYALVVDSAGKLGIARTSGNATKENPTLESGSTRWTSSAVLANNAWCYLTVSFHNNAGDGGTSSTVTRHATVNVYKNGGSAISLATDVNLIGCNGDASTSGVRLGSGMSVAGFYIDNIAISDTALMKSLATNPAYVVKLPAKYSATIGSDVKWSEITSWTPAKPAGGFEEDAELTINNTAAAKLTIDQDIKVATFKIENTSGKGLTLGFDGHSINAAFDKASAAGGVTIDVSGNWGAEIAKYAVAGAPYSYWYIYGSGALPDEPGTMPTLPTGYSAISQKYTGYGMRLVVTAPNTAKFGAVSINVRGGTSETLGSTTNFGLYPVLGSEWGYQNDNTAVTKDGVTFTPYRSNGNLETENNNTSITDNTKPKYIFRGFCKDYDDTTTVGYTLTGLNEKYARYRVIVYLASDSENIYFAPVKINDVTYCGPSTGTTSGYTIKGSTAMKWGHTGANHDSNNAAEGVNAVVSDVLTGDTVNIRVIRAYSAQSTRAQIAAIQVVKVGVMSYAAEVSQSCDWSGIQPWNPSKPASGFGTDDRLAITNTAADATVTLDETVSVAKLSIISAVNKNLTLTPGSGTLTSAAYDFPGANGKVTVGFGTGTAAVTAGSDTVLQSGGTGVLTLGANKKATITNGGWSGNVTRDDNSTLCYSGTTQLSSVPYTTGKNATTSDGRVVYGAPIANQSSEVAFMYSMTREFANGFTLTAPRFVTGNASQGSSKPAQTFVQNAGTSIIVNGAGDDTNTGTVPVLFAHWPSTVTYTMNGGVFDARQTRTTSGGSTGARVMFGRDGAVTMTIGTGTDDAWFYAPGIYHGDRQDKGTCTLTVGNKGHLVLGARGLDFTKKNDKVLKLSGGVLANYEANTIQTTANVTLEANSVVSNDFAMTISSVLAGSGFGITKKGSGVLTLSGANTYTGGTTVSAGTLVVTTPNGNYTVDGGTLTPVNPSETSEITVNQNGTFSYAQDISAGGTFAKSKFVANAGTVSLTVTMSKAQVQAEPKTAIALLGSDITATTGFDVTVLNADTGNPVENELTIEDNVLYVTPQGAQQTLTYTPTESGSFTWQVGSQIGAKKYRDYDNITFATTVYTNTVNAPSKIAATRLTVGGTYNFTGSMIIASLLDTAEGAYATFANDVITDSAIITNGTVMASSIVASEVAVTNATFGAKVLGPSMKYVRLTITATSGSGQQPAVGEFRLYRGSATTGYTILDWPKGTKISDCTGLTAVKETTEYPGEVGAGLGSQGGNECQPGDLVDGFYGNKSTPKCYGTGAYNTPAYNKWWPTSTSTQPWTVTIEFPDPVAMFSGCNFCLADHEPRNPTAWKIEVSSDGTNWTTVNETTGATWSSQYAWGGGNENVPAFLNTGTTPTDVAVGTGSTIVADGNWTAALEVGGNVTFKGVAGANLTLDAASKSKFDDGAALTFDLTDYDVSQAGKQYVIAGPTAGWPETSAITVIPSTFKLFKDDAGYYVEVVSGTYWIGDQAEGVGTWDLNHTQAWGKDAATSDKAVWLNGDEAFFTRNGTVTISGDGVDPNAINITSNNDIAVTLNNAEKITGKAFKIGSTNVTVTLNVGDAMTLGAVTAVADSTPKFVKTGTGTLTVNSGNQFAGGAIVVSNGTLSVGDASAFTGLGTLTAEDAGVIDVNGKALTRAFTLGAGGSLVNNGNSIGNGSAQMNTLTLTGNASVGGSGNFGLITNNYNASSLNLGAYTLTKTGANSFWLCNTTISGTGTIQVDAGTLAVSDNSGNAKTTTFVDGTISVGASGTLQVDSNKTLTLGKLSMTTGATITNNGTINGLKELTDVDLTAVGGTLGFHADGVTVKGTVKISDGKFGSANVIVADEAKIDLAIDASAYEATITTGTLTFPPGKGKGVADCVTINGSPATTWKILENGKIYDTSRLAYYAANVTATPATWSTKAGLTKTSADDWANGVKSTITLASLTADAELTFDVATTAAVLKVTGAQNLTLKKGQDVDVQIASIDLTEATGKITIDFNPGAATIKTGVDTVLNAVGTGNITIGTDHVLTVKGSGLTASKVTNNGTLKFEGGDDTTPIAFTGDADFGVTQLAADTVVDMTTTMNHTYNVTGTSTTTSKFIISRSDDGTGVWDNSQFRTLTLVANVSKETKSFWLERQCTDATVDVVSKANGISINGTMVIGALSGEGPVALSSGSLTLNPAHAATYSGTSSMAMTVGGTAEQSFTGNYTGALTVLANAKAALKVGATYALNVNNAGMLRLIDNETPQTTLTAATFNNTGTLNLSGTGINTLAIGTLTSFGTVTWPAEVAGTVKITSGGATRDFSEIKTKLSGFSGAVELDITETLAENAAGQVALTGAPAGAKIVLTRIDGSVIEGTASAEGAFTQKVDVLAYGAACLFDYTFTNTVVVAAGSRNKDYALQFDKGISPIYSETEDSMLLYCSPWIQMNNLMYSLDTFSVAMYGKVSATNNTFFISFGSGTQNHMLFLASNADGTKVDVVYYDGTNHQLSQIEVPNMTTASHLYVFSKTSARDLYIYLDGALWEHVVSPVDLVMGSSTHSGVQFGSGFGTRPSPYDRVPSTDTTADVGTLRVYDYVVSEKQLAALKTEFPYSSPDTYARTVDTATTNWVSAAAWAKGGETFDTPDVKGAVKVTADADTTVSVNLGTETAVNYEKVTFDGTESISLVLAKDNTIPVKAMQFEFETDVTVTPESIDLGSAQTTTIGANGKLTIDLRGIDCGEYTTNFVKEITGTCTDSELVSKDKLAIIKPTEMYGRDMTIIYQSNNKYAVEVALKSDVTAMYWKPTETVLTNTTHLTDSTGTADYIWWQTMPITVGQDNTAALTSITGDCQNTVFLVNSGVAFNIGTVRTAKIGGTGNVTVKLTADEYVPGAVITAFVPAAESTAAVTKVLDPSGNDVTSKAVINGNKITMKKEAKIGSTYYIVLADAIEAAEAGNTVELATNVVIGSAITVGKSLVLAGDVYTLTGTAGFTIASGSTLTISNGYFGCSTTIGEGTLSLVGGYYTEACKTAWNDNVAEGHAFGQLAVTTTPTYPWQVLIGEAPTEDQEVLPVVDQNNKSAGSIVLDKGWVQTKTGSDVPGVQVGTLNTTDTGNGYKKWQNLILGLDGTKSTSIPVIQPVQTTEAKQLKFRLSGVNVDTGAGVPVGYRVWTGSTPGGRDGGATEAVLYDVDTAITLPDTGVKYYTLEVSPLTSK